MLNSMVGPVFPNWNLGFGAYAFWFAEACGLSLAFGAYPFILYAYNSGMAFGLMDRAFVPKELRLAFSV